jgi:hypothetical protein
MPLRAVLLVGLTILAICAVAADEPPPEVELEPRDGDKVVGRLLNPTIRLKTDYGAQEVESRVIQRITFSPGDEPGHDMIEFTDGNHVRGEVLTERIEVDTGPSVRSFTPKAVREIKTTRKPDLGLGAIVLGLIT